MASPLYLLVGLMIGLSYPVGVEPLTFARPERFPAVAGAIVGSVLLYGLLTWAVQRKFLAPDGGRHGAGLRLLLRTVSLLLFAALVYVFHLPLWVWRLGLEDNILIGGLVILSPLLALLGTGALVAARAEQALRGGGVTAAGYLSFAFRSWLGLALLPILVILSLDLLFQRVEGLQRLALVYPFTVWIVLLVALSLLMIALPPILRLTFCARPLLPGPVRERLERLCRRSGFRYGALLSVPTSGLALANAFIVGLVPRWRYVFFTDAILAGMSTEQLECVLAHEIVHAKRRHILFYLLFSMGFVLLGAFTGDLLEKVGAPPFLATGAMLGFMLFFWLLLFGYVSRRFESEADVVAARIASPPDTPPGRYAAARQMAATLGALARLNGIPLSGWSWRHFSLVRRIQILGAAESDPAVGHALERRCEGLRSAALTFVLITAGCGVWLAMGQAARAEQGRAKWEAYERVDRGRELQRQGRYEEAAREIRAGIEAGASDAHFWLWVAECERLAGRLAEAQEAETRARKGPVTDPRYRLLLEHTDSGADRP